MESYFKSDCLALPLHLLKFNFGPKRLQNLPRLFSNQATAIRMQVSILYSRIKYNMFGSIKNTRQSKLIWEKLWYLKHSNKKLLFFHLRKCWLRLFGKKKSASHNICALVEEFGENQFDRQNFTSNLWEIQ